MEADTFIKAVRISAAPPAVATALASIVLPVPGGPNSSTPCGRVPGGRVQGRRSGQQTPLVALPAAAHKHQPPVPSHTPQAPHLERAQAGQVGEQVGQQQRQAHVLAQHLLGSACGCGRRKQWGWARTNSRRHQNQVRVAHHGLPGPAAAAAGGQRQLAAGDQRQLAAGGQRQVAPRPAISSHLTLGLVSSTSRHSCCTSSCTHGRGGGGTVGWVGRAQVSTHGTPCRRLCQPALRQAGKRVPGLWGRSDPAAPQCAGPAPPHGRPSRRQRRSRRRPRPRPSAWRRC